MARKNYSLTRLLEGIRRTNAGSTERYSSKFEVIRVASLDKFVRDVGNVMATVPRSCQVYFGVTYVEGLGKLLIESLEVFRNLDLIGGVELTL